MTNFYQALDWAESVSRIPATPRAQAAAELIKSLPGQWVDVKKVWEIIEKMNEHLELGCSNDYGQGFNYSTRHWREALESLFTPKLPTLAELVKQGHNVDDYLFTWVDTEDGLQLVTQFDAFDEKIVYTTNSSGYRFAKNWEEVIPRSDLLKVKWPIEEEPETTDSDSDSTPAHIPSSEVPPNEPWLIECADEKAIGTRYQGDAPTPWAVAALDGSFAGDYNDNEVSLIHKLTPETHTLPEGMRVADHEKFGRVVTGPRVDEDDDYKVFFLDEEIRGGADYDYAHDSTLDFLDGVK